MKLEIVRTVKTVYEIDDHELQAFANTWEDCFDQCELTTMEDVVNGHLNYIKEEFECSVESYDNICGVNSLIPVYEYFVDGVKMTESDVTKVIANEVKDYIDEN